MSDVTENKVLQGINELRDTLARDNPPFAEAMADERRTEAFCARVRAELASSRKAMHLDQAEMGRRLGLSQSAISKIESGTGDIGLKTIHRYASALGLEPVMIYAPKTQGQCVVVGAAYKAPWQVLAEAQTSLLQKMSDIMPEVLAEPFSKS